MKRIFKIFGLVFAVLLLFCSCEDAVDNLFVTDDYRMYNSFYKHYKDCTDKQTVLDKLGYPEAYFDALGSLVNIPYSEREEYEEELMSSDGTVWSYSCHKYSDPAEPYRLKITFNEEGKSVGIEFQLIPGG